MFFKREKVDVFEFEKIENIDNKMRAPPAYFLSSLIFCFKFKNLQKLAYESRSIN